MLMVGVNICVSASAVVLPSAGMDIDVVIAYKGQEWHYSNTSECTQLELHEQNNRGMYQPSVVKRGIVGNLIDLGYDKNVAYNYCLIGLDKLVGDINQAISVDKEDSSVHFHSDRSRCFEYKAGHDGREVDVDKLALALIDSSCHNARHVQLPIKIDKAITVEQLQANTVLKGTFCTTYSANANRVCNIKLASRYINGTVVGSGKMFSFNDIVGDRSTDRGFASAPIIVDGKYVSGVGGGICQVSTTLYNCALLSGLDVVTVCQHSLVPRYCMPSFDAMVSGDVADLKFINNGDMPIYIQSYASDNKITFNIYGQPNEYKYVMESQVIRQVPCDTVEIVDLAKYPQLQYKDEFLVVSNGSDYVESKGYLLRYSGEKLVDKTLIRHNKYKAMDRVIARGDKEPLQ